MKRLIVTSLATLLGSIVLLGQLSFAAGEQQHPKGDAAAGKTKSLVCAGCHGADGIGIAPTFPSLAGQVPGYTAAQLAAFKNGTRKDATMPAMVAALSEQDMLDLDAYYAEMTPKPAALSADQEAEARLGEAIYRGGIKDYSVSACMACHGPAGQGVLPNFPQLAGQSATYIEKQLKDFKSGVRSDPMMNPIAFPLSEAQIKQLALYISALY